MTIFIDIDLNTDSSDVIALCTPASHVDIHPGNESGTRPVYSMLRGLVFAGVRYEDHGAACICANMQVYRYCDYAYTVCERHGFQAIGTLRREMTRGGPAMTTLGARVDTVIDTLNKEKEVSRRYAIDFPKEANAEADFRKRINERRDEFVSKVEALIEEYQL